VRPIDYLRELWSSMSRNRARTAVAGSGVAWGTFLLITMLAFSNSLDGGVRNSLVGSAANAVFLWGERTTVAYGGRPAERAIELTADDAVAVRAAVPGIDQVAPRYEREAVISHGERSGVFTVMGDHPEIAGIELLDIAAGRFVNELDLRTARRVVVLGSDVAAALLDSGDFAELIGNYVTIQHSRYLVVGICRSRGTGTAAAGVAATGFIPFTAFERTFEPGAVIDWLAITAAPGASADDVQAAATALLKRRHRISPDDDLALGSFSAARQYSMIVSVMAAIRAAVWVVGILTLLSSAVGVGNIMLIAVAQRRREIGVRRALGASPASITRLIIFESVAVVIGAGAVGLIAAGGAIRFARGLIVDGGLGGGMLAVPQVSLTAVAVMASVLITTGAVAGWLPARRAVRVPAVKALADV
jgi:putative ABC transport system permease protein